MTERLTILCLSSQLWEDGMWTNKQHVMSRIAQQHRVIYVNFGNQHLGPFLTRAASEDPDARLGYHNVWRRPFVRRIHPSLEIVDVWSAHWFYRFAHGHPVRVQNEFEHRLTVVRRWLREQRIGDAVVWVYHPGYGASVASLPHRLILYDCVDEYSAFPEFKNSADWIRRRERELCSVADVVSCTAPALYEAKRELAPGRTHLVHNVGDAEHFERAMDKATPVPADLGGAARPVIGFIGAVSDYKLDTDWLIALAEARPAWTVALVGPTGVADPGTDVSKLAALPNVKLLGHRPYAALPGYLKAFDVAVIPYRLNDYTRSVFPIKFFEFLASGRPVVISALPAVREFWGSVRVAETSDDFIRQCDAALANDTPEAQERRVALARQNSWPERVRKLLGLVEGALRSREDRRRPHE
jgi:glycosyltransferase involved in cell wall biosynthesis